MTFRLEAIAQKWPVIFSPAVLGQATWHPVGRRKKLWDRSAPIWVATPGRTGGYPSISSIKAATGGQVGLPKVEL